MTSTATAVLIQLLSQWVANKSAEEGLMSTLRFTLINNSGAIVAFPCIPPTYIGSSDTVTGSIVTFNTIYLESPRITTGRIRRVGFNMLWMIRVVTGEPVDMIIPVR